MVKPASICIIDEIYIHFEQEAKKYYLKLIIYSNVHILAAHKFNHNCHCYPIITNGHTTLRITSTTIY